MKYIVLLFVCVGFAMSCDISALPAANTSSKVICEIKSEWNANTQIQKTIVQFYVQDSLGRHPYFLQSPLYWNQQLMKKTYAKHKGVYYQQKDTLEHPTALLLFENLDTKKHELRIDFPELSSTKWSKSVKLDSILHMKIKDNTTWVLVDSNSKMWSLNESLPKSNMALGKATLLQVAKKDSLHSIQGNLWLNYQLKSIAKGQGVTLEK